MSLNCDRIWSNVGRSLLSALLFWSGAAKADAAEEDRLHNWSVQPGFSLSLDSDGYRFPTSIVFVPNPGANPKDPLYFVGELRGAIKVVTNDRSVYTFADGFFDSNPPQELPEAAGSVGLFGLCLAPEHGYIYATFARRGEHEQFENRVIRFDTKPRTFAVEPESNVEFSDILASRESRFEATTGHQIGACQVRGDQLFVGIGDGEMSYKSQDLGSTLGKILRMTLDGEPLPENPFYTDDDVTSSEDFIWAYGLRNPFGQVLVDGRIFVADNGPLPDRFLEIKKGGNYLYDGSNESIAANSIMVFMPGRGLGHVVYQEDGADFLPKRLSSTFFLTLSGPPEVLLEDERPEIVALRYDRHQNLLLSRPETLVRYEGSERQALASVGLGPDGLYFAPVLPGGSSTTAVYKLKYSPDDEHPVLITADVRPSELISEYGCLGCHELDGAGTSRGPSLDREGLVERIKARLDSASYAEQAEALEAREEAPLPQWTAARQEILDAKGMVQVKKWLTYRLMEPRFDDPEATMPDLGLSEAEAAAIAEHLVEEPGWRSSIEDVVLNLRPIFSDLLPQPRVRHLAYFFLAGLVGGGVFGTGLGIFWCVRRRRRRSGSG